MRHLLGAEADEFLQALMQPPVVGLRVNTLKIGVEAFRALSPWPLEPVPWCESGFIVADEARPGQHPYHAAGLFYLQEPSAMAAAEALAPKPGEWVLDLAAAPGGKTTQLVSLMRDQGVLVANEVERHRTAALAQNVERWGARRAIIVSEEPARLAEQWGPIFDRVLLDAPCSGEGMFRKSEAALDDWSLQVVQGCAIRQGRALASAVALVRPGGLLAYSTCTFAPEENEQVIARFLCEHRDFEIAPLHLAGAQPGRPDWVQPEAQPDLMLSARLWPHRVRGEGHFVALLRRKTEGDEPRAIAHWTSAPKRAQALWLSFVADHFAAHPARDWVLVMQGERLYAVPPDAPRLDGLKVVRAGLWLGTVRADRFVPSHSLALSLRRCEIGDGKLPLLDFSPADECLLHYLQGHPLDEPGPNGWVLITVSGFPLSWGRRAQGVIKNLYPKGLRRPQ